MESLRIPVIAVALAAAPQFAVSQATTMSPQGFHDRVVAVIVRRAPKDMPSGDTTITWHRTPILYHIVRATPNGLRSGFLRNDSLVGLADATWGVDGLQEFAVRWTAADSVVMSLRAVREGAKVFLTGAHTDTLLVPTIPWAIADYGMDEHLVPMFRRLRLTASVQRVAVYRPWGGKWDTLDLVVSAGLEGSVRIQQLGSKDTVLWVIAQGGTLLQLMSGPTPDERRPLEETYWYAMYRRLRFMPSDAK